MTLSSTYVLKSSIQCNNCKEILDSTHRHDYRVCKCGKCMIDGGVSYRRSFVNQPETNLSIVIDLKTINLLEELNKDVKSYIDISKALLLGFLDLREAAIKDKWNLEGGQYLRLTNNLGGAYTAYFDSMRKINYTKNQLVIFDKIEDPEIQKIILDDFKTNANHLLTYLHEVYINIYDYLEEPLEDDKKNMG